MDRRIKSYLFDIITCIEEIHDFFEGQEFNLDSLLGDRKTLRAVERNLEIIGEAIKRLINLSPDLYISNTREIIGARNFIAHEYGSISYEIIIKINRYHLPILNNEVNTLLENS